MFFLLKMGHSAGEMVRYLYEYEGQDLELQTQISIGHLSNQHTRGKQDPQNKQAMWTSKLWVQETLPY